MASTVISVLVSISFFALTPSSGFVGQEDASNTTAHVSPVAAVVTTSDAQSESSSQTTTTTAAAATTAAAPKQITREVRKLGWKTWFSCLGFYTAPATDEYVCRTPIPEHMLKYTKVKGLVPKINSHS